MGTESIISDISKKLPLELLELLFLISKRAERKNYRIFLVGGLVRDLLLGLEAKDVDILVQGPAIGFVQDLNDNWRRYFPNYTSPNKLISFPRYGTSKLFFAQEVVPGLRDLDFSTARIESYPKPGQAPIVKSAKFEMDLARRDFSINTLALEILPNKELIIHDLHQGLSDLQDKSLRILHPKSFLEDPARLIRAIRFANRFSFTFESATENLFKEGLKNNYLNLLTPNRLLDEFRKALEEKQVLDLLKLMDSSGMLKQIIPQFDLVRLESAGEEARNWQQTLYLISAAKDKKVFAKELERFRLSPKEIQKIVEEV